MDCFYESDFLVLLTPEGDIPSDISIKFEGRDETLSVHKFILAKISPVYREQFYGQLSSQSDVQIEKDSSGAEILLEKEFSYEAFHTFIRHIYGDEEIIEETTSFGLLFELLELSKHYLLTKLDKVIQATIRNLKVDFENILGALAAALKHRSLDGFEELSEDVISRVKYLVASLTNEKLNLFYDKNMDDNPDLIRSLVKIMADKKIESRKHKSICGNCKEEICKDGKEVNVIPHVGMKFTKYDDGKLRVVKSVTTGGKGFAHIEYYSYSRSCNYPNDFSKDDDVRYCCI